ncbi:phosphoribosyltransferase domain-containing protein [Kitasatospora sp. NPDC086791]|uniref:phosphoribosyltransferase n=1 Tax=Kitasatospora sp. NPDC086791 TaxID=3155178 RepID=UPI0034204272
MTPTAGRVFNGRATWFLTEEAFTVAAALIAEQERPRQPDVVIGLARGGVPLARRVAELLQVPVAEVNARHNSTDDLAVPASGQVILDEPALLEAVAGTRRVLVTDDICGSGATLHAVRDLLLWHTEAELRTAALCRNASAAFPVDTWVYGVGDWVVFPWETAPPPDHALLPVPARLFTTPEVP